MTHNFTIDLVGADKLDEALKLALDVFMEFDAPLLSQEGAEEFKRFLDTVQQRLAGNKMKLWACSCEGKIIGVLGVRPPCHINMLFVDGAHHRKGAARAMFDKIVEYHTGQSCNEVTVNSSPYAAEVYRKLGFVETGAEELRSGIRSIPMKRGL